MKDIKSTIREEYNSKTNPYHSVDLDNLKTSVMNATEKEITKTKEELKKLKNDLEKFPSLYCDKYGHRYVTTNYRYLGKTGWGSILVEKRVYETKEECTVCGKTYHIPALELDCRPDTCVCTKQLPEDLYDDQSLQIDGKTYRMTETEISRLEDYLEYIDNIKSSINDLINQTLERERQFRNIRRCKIILWKDYINYIKRYPIIYSTESFLGFPTFEEYENSKQNQMQSFNNTFGVKKNISTNETFTNTGEKHEELEKRMDDTLEKITNRSITTAKKLIRILHNLKE